MNATLNPNVLRWARNKAGLSEDALADKVGVNLGVVKEWESSGSIPVNLVEKLAEKTRVAFGFLFLAEPPRPTLPISDFRSIDDVLVSSPSDELLEIIYNAQLKQNWYREYMIANGEKPLPFVGQSTLKTPTKETAQNIRRTLDIGPALAAQAARPEDMIRFTTEAAEDKGILVLRSGYAGDTSRRLSVGEFRGFAMSDNFAPLIFVNGADAPAAQIFTIAHEIAHIWVGKTGVSNLERTYSAGSAIETYCNSVAAEVLLPLEEIHTSWQAQVNDLSEIGRLSHKYKISRIVIARRALDAGLLTEDRDEIMAREDRLSLWCKSRKQMFIDTNDGKTFESMKLLTGWVVDNYHKHPAISATTSTGYRSGLDRFGFVFSQPVLPEGLAQTRSRSKSVGIGTG